MDNFKGYQLAVTLEDYILDNISSLPKSERYNLNDQIVRSSNSISVAIKTGEETGTLQGKAYELSRAIGSSHETATWALIAKTIGYWSAAVEKEITSKANHIIAILTSTLKSMIEIYGEVEGINDVITPNVRNLIAFQRGLTVLDETYKLLELKGAEIHNVHSERIRKSICSVLANLSESNVPYYNNRKMRLMDTKKAIRKFQHQLEGMSRRNVITEESFERMNGLSQEIHRIVNKLLSVLINQNEVINEEYEEDAIPF